MSLRTRFFAMTYDRQIAGAERAGLRAFRERLLAGASGDVLEIGGGTGANLPCYGPAVTSLTITEPQPPMLRRLERKVRENGISQHGPGATVLRAPAEDLPFEDGSFDVAVSTLVLCGVDDQPRALLGNAGELGQDARARAVAVARQYPHHLDPRPETGRAPALPARAPHGHGSARLRVRHRLGRERGLAHAGLARQQDDPARAPDRGVDRRTQRADRQPPSDKHVRRHTPILTLKMGNSPTPPRRKTVVARSYPIYDRVCADG
ncbi:MAG TPA: class I SAM-dependent methyltransferase [Streptosporangiaceae bacterium]